MTTVVISQPMYFPWPGFLAQLSMADVMIWLDDATFSKGSFTNRVQVRLPNGMSWLSIPLEGKGSGQLICDLQAAKPGWLDAHLATAKQAFKSAPHKTQALDLVEGLRAQNRLCDTITASSETLAAACGIGLGPTHRSSEMGIGGKGSERVLRLVKECGGTRYVTGHGARNYLDHEAFEAAGVAVEYMDYAVKPWGEDTGAFSPYVTGLDLLAHVGGQAAASHLNPRTRPWRDFV